MHSLLQVILSEMADWVNDVAPMLSDDNVKSKKYTVRSASMSIPTHSSYEDDSALVSHTGPLRGEKSLRFIPLSGPQYSNRRPEWIGVRLGKQQSKTFVDMPEDMAQNGWREGDHGRRNKHLLMSGPLGLCNNPDCTSCPAAYKTKQTTYKHSLHLDTKVLSFFHSISMIICIMEDYCNHHDVFKF